MDTAGKGARRERKEFMHPREGRHTDLTEILRFNGGVEVINSDKDFLI